MATLYYKKWFYVNICHTKQYKTKCAIRGSALATVFFSLKNLPFIFQLIWRHNQVNRSEPSGRAGVPLGSPRQTRVWHSPGPPPLPAPLLLSSTDYATSDALPLATSSRASFAL